MNKIYIIPTGNEIKDGIVLDLDSGEIMTQILKKYPQAEITRICPLIDEENIIVNKLNKLIKNNPDLIVLIGGSGGGHRYSKSLGKDFTHSSLEMCVDEFYSREIYGKNGHMWSKLICGKKDNVTIINVPGPFVEASAAIKAFIYGIQKNDNLEDIVHQMAISVFNQYPKIDEFKIEHAIK